MKATRHDHHAGSSTDPLEAFIASQPRVPLDLIEYLERAFPVAAPEEALSMDHQVLLTHRMARDAGVASVLAFMRALNEQQKAPR